MTAILPALANAYNDTGRQIASVSGVLVALSDLVAEHEALNTPDPRANTILVLIEVLKDQVAKLGELHAAEWRAMNAGPFSTAAE